MRAELRPPHNSTLVPFVLIEQVVRMMRIAERVESKVGNLLYASHYLLWREGMTHSKEMLVLANSVNEDGLAVYHESFVAVLSG